MLQRRELQRLLCYLGERCGRQLRARPVEAGLTFTGLLAEQTDKLSTQKPRRHPRYPAARPIRRAIRSAISNACS
jgi:hypothetical protein